MKRFNKRGKREKLEDVIYVESYKEYNAHNPYTNTCCCILWSSIIQFKGVNIISII